jgi:hypothetical protein
MTWDVTYIYMRVYSTGSRAEDRAARTSTPALKAKVVLPKRIEDRFNKVTARISVPPADPTDRRMIPDPRPLIMPASIALGTGSWMATGKCTHCKLQVKAIMPAALYRKKRRPTNFQPMTKRGRLNTR